MPIFRVLAVGGFVLLGTSGCGSAPPTTPTTPPASGPQTTMFSGSASVDATGGCRGNGHAISTGAGTVTISLTQASAARVNVQVCHPSAVNHSLECTVPPFATIAPGQPITATLKGGRAQEVTVYPDTCGTPTTQAVTVTYSISVMYPGGVTAPPHKSDSQSAADFLRCRACCTH